MKHFIATIILAFSPIAFAQVPVAVPSEPIITPTNTTSPNAAAALASASTNKVFIDQSGNNPNLNINQIGSGNNFGSVSSSVMLRGNNINITSIQEGNNNAISLNLKSNQANSNTNLTIKEIGNNNVLDAACGSGTSSGGTSLTGCNNTTMNWQFNGNGNSLQFRGSGDNINSSINMTGNFNGLYMDVIGNNHTQTIVSSGDYNSYNITQNSSGANGSSLVIDQTGNSTTYTVQQSGTVDNVLNIRSVANGGTFNILQRN